MSFFTVSLEFNIGLRARAQTRYISKKLWNWVEWCDLSSFNEIFFHKKINERKNKLGSHSIECGWRILQLKMSFGMCERSCCCWCSCCCCSCCCCHYCWIDCCDRTGCSWCWCCLKYKRCSKVGFFVLLCKQGLILNSVLLALSILLSSTHTIPFERHLWFCYRLTARPVMLPTYLLNQQHSYIVAQVKLLE